MMKNFLGYALSVALIAAANAVHRSAQILPTISTDDFVVLLANADLIDLAGFVVNISIVGWAILKKWGSADPG